MNLQKASVQSMKIKYLFLTWVSAETPPKKVKMQRCFSKCAQWESNLFPLQAPQKRNLVYLLTKASVERKYFLSANACLIVFLDYFSLVVVVHQVGVLCNLKRFCYCVFINCVSDFRRMVVQIWGIYSFVITKDLNCSKMYDCNLQRLFSIRCQK